VKRLVLSLAAACSGVAATAQAQAYDALPFVDAEATAGSAASISASMDVGAPPSAVWSALTDCEHAARFMPKLISCRIVEKGPGDAWEIREHRLEGGLFQPVMRNVFRVDFIKDRRLSFHRVGGDWKVSQGVWTLSALDGGKGTHVTYHTDVAVNGPVPVSWVRAAVAKGMPASMLALRKEAVSRSRTAGGAPVPG
jgi:uncharacterized protein YndB with AHSA1/START domain